MGQNLQLSIRNLRITQNSDHVDVGADGKDEAKDYIVPKFYCPFFIKSV